VPDLRGPVVLATVAGLVAIGVGVATRRFAWVTTGGVALVAGFVLSEVDHDAATVPALAYGVLLLVTVELAADATLGGADAFADHTTRRSRRLDLATVVGAGAAGGVAVVLAEDLLRGGGAAQLIGGALAALAITFLVGVLVRRATSEGTPRDDLG
jgi:hypothetical protein